MYELHVSVASCEIVPQNPTEEALLSFVLFLSTYLEKFRKIHQQHLRVYYI